MTRVALYARYSSDNQREASVEDQLRLCRQHAEREGWTVVESYHDRAISGASLIRPGIQVLMQDAQRGGFDIVLAEARSEEHTSELQSLMRISYAVFCLKKKTNYKNSSK